jgi:nucleoside-diphosphate-sugar epimerase
VSEALILGCGYTGLRLARLLGKQGHEVVGTTRDPDRAERLAAEGVRPLLVDVATDEGFRTLASESPEVCFHLVPPVGPAGGEAGSDDGDPDGNGSPAGGDGPGGEADGPLPDDGPLAVERVIRALRRAPLEAFVYGSSTGVYGDRGGAWVDESDVPRPDASTGRRRLAAERAVLRCGWEWDCRPRIGRIAGIYGPDRVLLDTIRSGRYHVVEGLDAWTNRIHVDDLARGLAAVWRAGENGRVYDMTDGRPHRSSDFARLVADLAGLELPTLTREEARERYSAKRWARKAGSKRVRGRRLREELAIPDVEARRLEREVLTTQA